VKGWGYLAVFVVEVVALAALLPLVADVNLHARVEQEYGLNRYGTRGRIRLGKGPAERRILLLGGREAFGPGLRADTTLPFYLRNFLNNPVLLQRQRSTELTVINAAERDGGARSLEAALRDYLYFEPEVVGVYLDESTSRAGNDDGMRRRSPLFRKIGYYPIVPGMLQARTDGAHGAAAVGWRAATAAVNGLEALVAAVAPPRRRAAEEPRSSRDLTAACATLQGPDCPPLARLVRLGLERSRLVFIASHPFLPAAEIERHRALVAAFHGAGADARRLVHLDVRPQIALGNPTLRGPAGMTARGASHIAETLSQMLSRTLDAQD